MYEIVPLEIPSAPGIQRLEKLAKQVKEDGLAGFEEAISPLSPADFGNVLPMFTNTFNAKAKGFTRRVMLITDNDTPAGNMQTNRTRARDLKDSDVTLEVYPWGTNFEFRTFYDEFRDEESQMADFASLDKFRTVLRIRTLKKRAAFKIPLLLDDDNFEIALIGYNLITERSKPVSRWSTEPQLVNGSIEPLNERSENVCIDSSNPLLPTDIKHAWVEGKVAFSKTEYENIMFDYGEPSLTLLGFKPIDSVPKLNVHHSLFLYPDEQTISGSTSVLAHLISRLVALKKAAICRYVARRKTPAIVALIPQWEDGAAQPSGFHMVRQPYADDVRDIAEESVHPVEATAVAEAASKIGDRMLFKYYRPKDFPNPSLQKFYSNLEALALGTDVVPFHDLTTVDRSELAKDEIADFNQSIKNAVVPSRSRIESDGTDTIYIGKKRPVESADSLQPPAPKRSRSKSPVTHDADSVKEKCKSGQLSKLTIAHLKAFLESVSHKPKSTAKKPDLIALVEAYFESE